MTNNDELAIKLKSAADAWQNADEKYDRAEITISDFVSAADQYNGIIKDPANILSLLAERDADKKHIAKLEREKETMTAAALAMRDDMRDARSLLEAGNLSRSAVDVLAERRRQVTAEGWTPEHDDTHESGELAGAAACYARHVNGRQWVYLTRPESYASEAAPNEWPWDERWWKPKSPRSDLVRAAALILAEIERLDRAAGIKLEVEEV